MKISHAQTYRQVKGFLSRGVWSTDISDIPRLKAYLYRVVRFLEHVITSFIEDRCLLRASALTYSSLLSLVPLLALMFAILKGLGVQRRLEPYLLEKFALGSEEVVSRIVEYIDRTNVGTLGVAGVVTLVVTAIVVLKNMERSFNWIWKVHKGRSWLRTSSDYLSILVIAPLCLLVALSLTTYVSSLAFIKRMETIWILGGFYRFALRMSPFVILWIALTFCYVFMPNTRVRFSSALLGGVIGGTLWQFAQWGYVRYQFGVAKYNAIYGALSQLPILLIWIYVSWVIVLFGAEIAFAHQNLEWYTERKVLSFSKAHSLAYRILQVLRAVAARFVNGEPPYTVDALGQSLKMSRILLDPCLERLAELGWIAPWEGNESMIVFQRPPERMPLHQVLEMLADGAWGKSGEFLMEIIHRADEGIRSALRDVTVQDLVSEGALDETEHKLDGLSQHEKP